MEGTKIFDAFEAKVENIQKINPLFSKCKILVMYTGLNRNGSNIPKSVVENALPTMYNIPIVGEFVEQKEDFGGHGGRIVIDDSGMKFEKTTKPYGVVPESAKFSWETITELDGTTHEYLAVDGAYLWTGRYEEAFSVIQKGKGQSMEVEFTKGNFDTSGVYTPEDMVFSALCILGDDVEPCFPSASVSESFTLNKDEFKAEFSKMVSELKEFMLQENKEGGNDMPEVTTDVQEQDFSVDQEEEFKANDPDNDGDNDASDNGDTDDDTPKGDHSVDESAEFDNEEEFDNEGESEFDNEESPTGDMSVDLGNGDNQGDNDTNSPDSPVVANQYTAEEFETLKAEFDALKSEVESLRQFKADTLATQRKEAENAMFAKFAGQLTEEEIATLREKSSDFTLEDLETRIYALIGMKATQGKFSLNNKSSDTVRVPAFNEQPIVVKSNKPYADLVRKYSQK